MGVIVVHQFRKELFYNKNELENGAFDEESRLFATGNVRKLGLQNKS